MDALAAAGVWATDAHSPSTVCSPSRYAMLTGRYSWRGRLRRLNPWAGSAIRKDRITLPKMLKTKGYATACIGKWHLGFEWPWKGGITPEPDWYIAIMKGDPIDASDMLFDLSNDFGERVNLYDKYPERVQQMEARLVEIKKGKSTRQALVRLRNKRNSALSGIPHRDE